jgi:photosystem II stability/assembly factor-like uncharacterized protein
MDDISTIGGWPYNDSITTMLYTDNAGELWQLQDIFPGKMINSGLYYDNGVGICGGLNEVCYRTVDSGRVWVVSSFDIELNHRNINKFAKGHWGTAYACGGLDSINGFVMKTEDSGENWTIITEFPESEIHYIESIDNNNLIICGPENILKKTQNAGELWQDCEIVDYSENCGLNSIELFGENYGYCVGGRQGIDSLQLILKTIDGGDSWSPCLMSVNPCLNDIEIINDSTAYVVGDYGVILKTTNFGINWEEIVVTDNPGFHLYAIDFINSHFGVIAGNYGIVFYYNDGVTAIPEVNTYGATDVTSNSAKLNGSFNAGLLSSNVSFLYGLDETLENVIPRGTFNGGSLENLSYNLEGLEENTHYYYCIEIENDYGVVQGDIKVFYTGNPIPNWDFELWTEISKDFPENWLVNQSGFERVDYSGNKAIRLANDNTYQNDDIFVVMNADIEGDNIEEFHIPVEYISGGLPINERPDSIFINAKYNIEAQDSAMLFVALILDDYYVSENFFFITGNQSEFHNIGFEIDYLTGETPNRAVIAITNSNPFDTLTQYNSTIEISEIWFKNNSPEIPNSDFENWNTSTAFLPQAWYMDIRYLFDNDGSVINFTEQITDAAHHDYAIKLQNKLMDHDTLVARISLKDWDQGIPIEKRFSSFSGQYKYIPEAQDTARFSVVMYHNGEQCGWGHFENHETVLNWTNFTAEIQYDNPETVPDSMNLFIETSQWPATGESMLFIDKLSMDGDFIPVEVQSVEEIIVYPNPFRDYVTIISDDFTQDEYFVEVYNSAMILVRKFNVGKIISNEIKLDLSNFDQGVYFIKVFSKDKKKTRLFKIIKI